MHVSPRLPALFHRVFLSHLLVLAISFVAALILFDYLFVEGIAHFLVHSPIILIPVLLALIGLVGLLALWTAGAVAMPLERAVDAINAFDATAALERLVPETRVEEVARMVAAVRHKLGDEAPRRPFYLRLDALGNIRDGDIDTAARLGMTPDVLRRCNLRALLATPAQATVLREALHARAADGDTRDGDAVRELLLQFRGAAARVLPVRCLLYRLSGDETLLIGIPGKVM